VFTFNVCGARNLSADLRDREKATCAKCRSSIRFRSILLVLSRALFGADLIAPEFPILKSVRGMGISDSDIYSTALEMHFSYTNTYFHREPRFDLVQPDTTEFGKYDFVICSEVLEHIPAPVDRAFDTLARLLNPSGVLILTVPYAIDGPTTEHFPASRAAGLTEIDGRLVQVNRNEDGSYVVFDQLTFHGGEGETLEMRLFSESDLREKLAAAGLINVEFEVHGNPAFGVVYSGPCSVPIIARREPFSIGVSGIHELTAQLVKARRIIKAAKSSRWIRLGQRLGLGPTFPDNL
jgi:SAM-dependent methyltransferase